jgi:hypothetical protein
VDAQPRQRTSMRHDLRALLLLAGGVAIACSRSPEPPRSVTIRLPPLPPASLEPVPAVSAAAAPPLPSAGAASLLPVLRELHRFLERDKLTVGDIVNKVGTIKADPGLPMSMVLRPSAPAFQAARLARYPDGAPYLLEIELNPEARPTIQDLRDIFGEDRPSRGPHGERTTIFYPPSREKRWSVAVIADLSRCWDPHSAAEPPPGPCEPLHAGSRVEKLALRRDPGL